jgi:hypothetical protein
MSHEGPAHQETEHTPEVRLFNVDAMSDDQIVALYRGLTGAMESEIPGTFDSDAAGKDDRRGDAAVQLLEQLDADLSGLAGRDPERVKNLAEQCASSDRTADQELALGAAISLVHYDYPFTRDTLLALHLRGSDISGEGAFVAIPRLMRDELTPDQVADFNAHLGASGWEPMEPDPPER